jgi:predicted translation initiation factor SUI1
MKVHSFSDLHQLLPGSSPSPPKKSAGTHDGKGQKVVITLDTKGRKGKSVTIISGLNHNPSTIKEIARMLKTHCGTGGTVKNGCIELQGDLRVRAAEELQKMNYIVG